MKRNHTQEVSHKILAYLLRNPDAKDTLEGIVNWWLLQQDIQRNVVLVKKTVERLIAKGFILAGNGNDSKTYYYLNPVQIPVISALLVRKS